MDRALATPGTPQGSDLVSLLRPERERQALGFPDDDGYHESPKPHLDDITDAAEELTADHSLRLGMYKEYAEALEGDIPGHFTEDIDDIENDLIETMPINTMLQDYLFRCGFLSLHDPYPRILGRDSNDADEAMVIEDLVTFDFLCEERQYFREHGSDLRWNEAAHLQRFGMLVGLDVLDPTDLESGLAMSLIDPQTIFPVPGGRGGWYEIYRIFDAPNEVIVGSYGGEPGSDEYARIEKKVRRKASKKGSNRRQRIDRTENRSIIECWNKDWLVVVIDDEDILLERKHGMREIPFTIAIGSFDMPTGVVSGTSREPSQRNTRYGEITLSDRSVDIARQMRPYGWANLKTHRIAEAVAGRRLTMFKWAIDPHKVLEFDPATEHKLAEEMDLVPGETTFIPIPNKLTLVNPAVDPAIMQGLAMDLQANVGGGALTQLRMGAMPPQTSGSAMGKLISLGGASDTVLVRTWQSFKRARAELRLRIRMNFGDAIGEPQDLGILRVPSRNGPRTPLHAVTPAMIRRVGTQVSVEGYYWEPDVALAQYLLTLRTAGPTGAPLVDDATLREKLRIMPDPDRAEIRIKDEQLRSLPPVLHQETIARLTEEAETAREEDDWKTFDAKLVQIAELQFLHEQTIATGQAAPSNGGGMGMAGGGGGMGAGAAIAGITPPAPGGTPTPGLPGTSLPEQGIDVGHQGARPEGSTGPGTSLMPVTGGGGGGL